MSDSLQRFVFEHLDARGAIVNLEDSCRSIQETHHYPQPLAALLNQFAAAACLLRDSVKIDAAVTIQFRSAGAIELMMADCMADRKIRAIAEYDHELLPAGGQIHLNDIADDAVMAITITPLEGERYQGVVPIEHATLEQCLEDYFARSEQLPTWFRLLADEEQAVGIAIHALPKEKVLDADRTTEHFSRLQVLLKSLSSEEALSLESESILTRLFHEEACRLFEDVSVEFGCECSLEKSIAAIISLGKEETTALIAEQQEEGNDTFTVDCHFCFQRYLIPHADIESLLESP